jgi:alcohol dehydrogenase YqhD (iron-dependent ADH family)
MRNFDFQNPTRIIFGKNTIGRIGQEIRRGGHKLILVVAGSGSIRKNGVHDAVIDSLRKSQLTALECWGVQPNPTLAKTREIIEVAARAGVDAVLAVGGGSVIDTAKAVAAGVYVDDIWKLFEDRKPVMRALPIYTILTLSATGSEMNNYAVITREDEHKKWPIGGPALYPRVSIVDPSVQSSLPWEQTVNGAIDTISHTLEFYFQGGGETTLALDESLLRTVVSMTDRLQKNGQDYDARASLAWASTLALNGLSGTGIGDGDWATHGIEHGLSAVCPDVAHGAGLGVLFPAWILYCQDANPASFERWAKNLWNADTVEDGVAAYRAKIKAWGGAVTLKELGVKEDQIDTIATSGFGTGVNGVIKKLSIDDVRRILRSAFA